MGVTDNFFKKNIKTAFSRVKEHIIHIEDQLKLNREESIKYKEELSKLRREMESLRNEIKFLIENKKPSEGQNQGFQKVSSGNEGVYSDIHSFNIHSFNSYSANKQSNIHSDKIQDFKTDFDNLFNNLSKQEFLTFLTIYQLEEEITNVSYISIAEKLNLTEGCIRTYVSSLLKKGIPLKKKKYNNKQVFLYISPEFRSLDFKKKLVEIFYNYQDPHQKTLNTTF